MPCRRRPAVTSDARGRWNGPAMIDADRLKRSWELVAAYGDQVPLFFYSTLFLTHPQTRELFPVSMASQRDKLVDALGSIVSSVDALDRLTPFVQQLGRDHRKFAVLADHCPAVGAALLSTLRYFLGAQWTDELARDWEAAYGIVAKTMLDAAEASSHVAPPWWEGAVVTHEQRGPDVAVLTVKPNYRLDHLPGQSIAVETPLRPRLWRYYSPANLQRTDNVIELHVRLVDGGQVSPALVQLIQAGDVLRAVVARAIDRGPDRVAGTRRACRRSGTRGCGDGRAPRVARLAGRHSGSQGCRGRRRVGTVRRRATAAPVA